jgi:hypothetical protein
LFLKKKKILNTNRYRLHRFGEQKCPYTQATANKIYERWTIDLADSYAYIARTLFLSTWYASVAPLGIVFSLAGLFSNYWIDKYLLLRVYSIPKAVSEEVFTKVINILEILPLVYMCGNYEYELHITNSDSLIKFISEFFSLGTTSIALFFVVCGYIMLGRQAIA